MVKISKPFLVKIKKYFPIIVGVVLLVGAGFYVWQNNTWRTGINATCVKAKQQKITGTNVWELIGYYNCNEIKRGDDAIIKFKTREETFIKNIVGLPGDSLEFTLENQLKLNKEILKNSALDPYLFSESIQKIIEIPLEDGQIPEGRYLVLGEEKGPQAFDSRQFGFIQMEHLIGRAVGR